MTYSGAGVDIDAESSAVASLINSLAKSTRKKERRVLRLNCEVVSVGLSSLARIGLHSRLMV